MLISFNAMAVKFHLVAQMPRGLLRASYLAMDLITRFVILPLSLVPLLLTGPILSLGTPWGLFRH